MATKWTPELERSFALAWNSGVPIEVMQRRFHIGQETVEKTRQRLALPSRSPRPVWTEESEQRVRALWIEGKSATEIARIMGGGLTRNAVIGKCHRLGLTKATRPASAPPLRTGRVPKPRKIKALKPLPVDHKPRDRAPVAAAERSWQTPVSTPGIQRTQRAYGQNSIDFVETGAGVESPNARPFLDATRGCKWPLGQGAALSYCCNPLAGGDGVGRTYCAGHAAVAIDAKQPLKSRRDATPYLTRFDRIEPSRPVAANNNGSIWDTGRRAA